MSQFYWEDWRGQWNGSINFTLRLYFRRGEIFLIKALFGAVTVRVRRKKFSKLNFFYSHAHSNRQFNLTHIPSLFSISCVCWIGSKERKGSRGERPADRTWPRSFSCSRREKSKRKWRGSICSRNLQFLVEPIYFFLNDSVSLWIEKKKAIYLLLVIDFFISKNIKKKWNSSNGGRYRHPISPSLTQINLSS